MFNSLPFFVSLIRKKIYKDKYILYIIYKAMAKLGIPILYPLSPPPYQGGFSIIYTLLQISTAVLSSWFLHE